MAAGIAYMVAIVIRLAARDGSEAEFDGAARLPGVLVESFVAAWKLGLALLFVASIKRLAGSGGGPVARQMAG